VVTDCTILPVSKSHENLFSDDSQSDMWTDMANMSSVFL
jgi:hypothetical protein